MNQTIRCKFSPYSYIKYQVKVYSIYKALYVSVDADILLESRNRTCFIYSQNLL